jgi:ABC-type glycerol-3-phosphate transport system substrate-binding protein
MLGALQKLLTPDYVVNGSNSMDHTTAQTMFLNSDVAMMVNGSWLSNEVSGMGTVENYGVMKTPVISSIINKLTSVKTDMALRDLIDAIDAVTDGTASEETYRSGDHYVVKGVEITAADWEYVANARNILTTCYDGNGNFIPNYSDAKEGAKEFLKFYYSDEGMKIFTETVKQALPLKLSSGEIDTTNWNGFEQRMYELLFSAENFVCRQSQNIHPIYKYGGASAFGDVNYIVAFTSQNANQRKTADELWEMVLKDIEVKYDSWIKNIE